MPQPTRRFATRALLAAGGTLLGVLAARKLLTRGAGPEAPPLQTLAGLRPVSPPTKLPPFTWQVARPDGQTRPGSIADHAGHGVLLNIWATWCEPCTREMPSLARLAAILGPALAVLPVSIDRGGAGAVRAFYASHAIEGLPVLLDPDSTAMTALGVGGIPTSFLIGVDGTLRARFEGAADWSTPDAVASVRRLTGR